VFQGDNITIGADGRISATFGTITPDRQPIVWSGTVGNFEFTRTAAQHSRGATPQVQCFRDNVQIDCETRIAANGDVTVFSNANISGMIIEIR